jgi:biotin transport system substrate-specific component
VFAGPSAGFVLGFPVAAAMTGILTERLWGRLSFFKAFGANLLGGVAVLYACGVPVLAAMTGSIEAVLGSAIFLPGDILKAAIAASIALFVKRGYPLIEQSSGNRRVS